MRFRTAVGMLAGTLVVVALANPAAAQDTKVDFSAGYQYLRFTGYETGTLPKGWSLEFAAGKDKVKFVGQVGGNYGDPYTYSYFAVDHFEVVSSKPQQLLTFQGGVEISGPSHRVVPFVRLLTGAATWTRFGTSTSAVITPEAGAKVMITDHVGAQITVGVPVLFNIDGYANTFRFVIGVVYRK